MTTRLSFAEIQNLVGHVLRDRVYFVVLMGSAATDRFNSQSDIDLAVYFKLQPDHQQLAQIVSELEDQFGRDCDVVSLFEIDPIFARQVLETGRVLLVTDLSFYNIWKARHQLSIYPDFKRSRKIIEDNLLNRKKYV